jgi:ribosomal protein L30/L7E
MILPLDDFSDEEIKIIENMRLSKNNSYVEVEDNDWVATLNKIS